MTDAPDYRKGGRPPSLPELPPGVTYRRLDYWTSLGHIKAEGQPGSGHRRTWPASELAIAGRIAELREAGLTLWAAAKLARAEREWQDRHAHVGKSYAQALPRHSGRQRLARLLSQANEIT